MKKVRQLLMAAGVTALLAGCGPAQNSDTAAAAEKRKESSDKPPFAVCSIPDEP